MDLMKYKELLFSTLDIPEVKQIIESEEFCFAKAVEKYNEYINFEVNELIINELINKTQVKPFSFAALLNQYDEESIEYKILLLIGELVSYIDKNAAMKNELNQYEDKRTIASASVYQNIWVKNLLSYKLDNSLDNLPTIIRNALKYIQNPSKELTVLKEEHRQAIAQTFFDGRYESIIDTMRNIGIRCNNTMNDGYLYAVILYQNDIRKIWDTTKSEEKVREQHDRTSYHEKDKSQGNELENHKNQSTNENCEAEKYTKEDFLKEVFISEEQYETIISLLKRKRNIILQGAPGVGKTYAAKRLAYSLIGAKDKSKIKIVQFHQSYSYEDFIMGYKPNGTGFELKEGPFYKFCKEAAKNRGEDYFFIIDEINRGNISKIFGELLMLIESDKRDEEITLTYTDEPFCVPENLYIIGMMNTADRSLAIIDYALRRRFCFVELEPAFETESFKEHLLSQGASEELVNRIILKIGKLNSEIEKDVNLGKGFKIGHSYFCKYENTNNWYEEIIKYEIAPLIEEYWFDDQEKANRYIEELLR